jgi:bacterioferritin-associated ferredoxin
MIVCLCNGLSERDIRAAAARLPGDGAGELFRRLGCRVRCGKCVPYVAEIARETGPPPMGSEDQAQAAPSVAEAA